MTCVWYSLIGWRSVPSRPVCCFCAFHVKSAVIRWHFPSVVYPFIVVALFACVSYVYSFYYLFIHSLFLFALFSHPYYYFWIINQLVAGYLFLWCFVAGLEIADLKANNLWRLDFGLSIKKQNLLDHVYGSWRPLKQTLKWYRTAVALEEKGLGFFKKKNLKVKAKYKRGKISLKNIRK